MVIISRGMADRLGSDPRNPTPFSAHLPRKDTGCAQEGVVGGEEVCLRHRQRTPCVPVCVEIMLEIMYSHDHLTITGRFLLVRWMRDGSENEP